MRNMPPFKRPGFESSENGRLRGYFYRYNPKSLVDSLLSTLGALTPRVVGDADGNRLVEDFEGRWIPVKAEEARFQGQRRVENLVGFSEDFSNAAWNKVNTCTVTGTNTVNLPAIFDSINAPISYNTANKVSVFSLWLSGSGTTTIQVTNGIDQGFKVAVTLTATPTRYVVTGSHNTTSSTSGAVIISRDAGDTATEVTANYAQLEDSTGQSNQNPSDYVSTDVLSDPWHGANVDGVMYSQYLNGNTVASNVVTQAQDAAIDPSIIKGLLMEGTATEISGKSVDLGNWTKVAGATVAKDAVGLTGSSNEAFTVTDSGGALQYVQENTAVATNTDTHISVTRVAFNPAPSVYPRVTIYLSGGTPLEQSLVLDPSDGTYVETASQGSVLSVTRDGDFWVVIQSITNNSSNNDCILFLLPAFNTDGSGTINNAAQGSTVFASCELYKTAWSYSPVLTTGGTAKTRLADSGATFNIANWSDAQGSMEFVLTPYFVGRNGGGIISTNAAQNNLLSFGTGADQQVFLFDGTQAPSFAPVWNTTGEPITLRLRWGSGKMRLSYNGVLGAESNYDGSFNPSGAITLFMNLSLGAAMKDLRISPADLGNSWLELT